MSAWIHCAEAKNDRQQQATVEIKNAEGKSVGSAIIKETRNGVKMMLDLKNLPPGTHGIHFHEKGSCEGPKFTSAGGHFSAHGKKHGLENAAGPHLGDLPNIQIASDGTMKGDLMDPRVTLHAGETSLLKEGGTALVIHAGPDDQKTDPAGGSGDRIACGVIKEK
jgi:Cu-Zn family superoxide dismutase